MLDGSLNATPEERPLRLYRGSAASLPLVVVADDGSAVPLPDGLVVEFTDTDGGPPVLSVPVEATGHTGVGALRFTRQQVDGLPTDRSLRWALRVPAEERVWIAGHVELAPRGRPAGAATEVIEARVVTEQITVRLVPLTGLLPDAGVDGAGVWTLTRDTGIAFHVEQRTHLDGDTITDDWGWPYYPDGDAGGFLRGRDGVVRHYHPTQGGLHRVGVTTVTGSDCFAAPRHEVTIEGVPAGVYHWVGGGPVVDLGDGTGCMLLHLERGEEYGQGWFYWTLGAARVDDAGANAGPPTITWLGAVIDHELPIEAAEEQGISAGIASGHFVVRDGYVYVFHRDFGHGGVPRAAVSRCPLEDLRAAVDAGEPPRFSKWNGEQLDDEWGSPGLGGPCAPLATWALSQGDVVTLPDGRLLHVGTFGDPVEGWGLRAQVGTDPITWDPTPIEVVAPRTDTERYTVTLWSGDPASPKVLTGGTAVAYFVDSTSGVDGFRWDEYTVETLRLAPVVPAPPEPPEPPEPPPPPDLTQYQQRRAYFVVDPVVDLGDTDAFPDAGDVLVLTPGSVVKLPPVNDQRVRRWRILSGTEYAGGGSFTVTSDHALVSPTQQIEVPEGDAWDFTNPPGTGSWIGVHVGSLHGPQQPRRHVVADNGRIQTAYYGTPAFAWDPSAVANVAIEPGWTHLAHGSAVAGTEVSWLAVDVIASELDPGERIDFVCYEADRFGFLGPLVWSTPLEVTATGNLILSDAPPGLRLPALRYAIGVHNPSTNAGPVTLRHIRALEMPVTGPGAVATYTGVTVRSTGGPAPDLTGLAVHSMPLEGQQTGVRQDAPAIVLRRRDHGGGG